MKRLLSAAVRGHVVADVAALLRVSGDKIRRLIATGELVGINTADRGQKPRWVVLPDALADFLRQRQAVPPTPPKPARRKKRTNKIDFYPD